MNSEVSFCSEHPQPPALVISRAFHFGRSFSTEVHVECFHSDPHEMSLIHSGNHCRTSLARVLSLARVFHHVECQVEYGQAELTNRKKDVTVVKHLFLFQEGQRHYFPLFSLSNLYFSLCNEKVSMIWNDYPDLCISSDSESLLEISKACSRHA